MIKTKLTRRLFSGLAAVAPAAIAKAPAGLALGKAVSVPAAVPESTTIHWAAVKGPSPAAKLIWDQINGRKKKTSHIRDTATREAAGILDPEIQALTACSPVYRMHLQMQKDERQESIIQKLRDRIEQLEKLAG